MTFKAFSRGVYTGLGYPETERERHDELKNGYPNAVIVMSTEAEAQEEADRQQEAFFAALETEALSEEAKR
jgi:hypothetical protein